MNRKLIISKIKDKYTGTAYFGFALSELDNERRKSFLENIGNTQVIITCTEKFALENLKSFYYNVRGGKIY